MRPETKLLIYRLGIVITFAFIMGVSANTKNYILPIVSFAILILLSLIVNIKIKKNIGVTADERDWKISGKAAFWAIRIYAIPAAVFGFICVVAKDEQFIQQSNLYSIGQTVSFSVCIILFIYSIVFRILRNKGEKI